MPTKLNQTVQSAHLAHVLNNSKRRREVDGEEAQDVVEGLIHALHDQAGRVLLVAYRESQHLHDVRVPHGEVDLRFFPGFGWEETRGASSR